MILAAAIALAVPAASSARDPINIEFARAMVGSRLRDSGSARYLDVRYVADGLICGSVNAKNGRGGYTGYVDFAVYAWPSVDELDPIAVSDHKDLFSEVLIGYNDRMRDAVRELCKED